MTRADILVLVLAAALLGALYAAFWSTGAPGRSARIQIAGERWGDFPLAGTQTVRVAGALGESVLEIKDGAVRFLSSPCTAKVCVHAGWLRHAGEFAACLPNRVSVSITGPDPRYDAINF